MMTNRIGIEKSRKKKTKNQVARSRQPPTAPSAIKNSAGETCNLQNDLLRIQPPYSASTTSVAGEPDRLMTKQGNDFVCDGTRAVLKAD